MNAQPTVSIAIRGWRRDMIGDAIASVLAQTWTDLELIVYDDAGDLGDVCARYPDPRLRHVHAERKYGASGRWLAAVAHCRGDCIGLLDDDDRYAPQFVERLLAALRAHPQAGIAFCPQTASAIANAAAAPATLIEPAVARRMLVERWGAPTSTMLLRRDALDAALRLQPMPDGVSPDLYINFHVAIAGRQHVRVDAALCLRNGRGTRISNSLTGARYALATFQQLRTDDAGLERLRRVEVARRHCVLAAYLVMEGRRADAIAELRAARADADAYGALRRAVGVAARIPLLGPLAARLGWRLRLTGMNPAANR